MKQVLSVAARALLVAALFSSPAAMAQRDLGRPLPQDLGAEPGHLPKVHYTTGDPLRPYPLWVDASMILTKDGRINPIIEPSLGQQFLRDLLAAPLEGGCVTQDMIVDDLVAPPERDSVESATKNSRLVILGKVTERAFGVKVYQPGQLLRVVPQQTLKGQPRTVPAYFVFVPVGNLKIGNVPICAKDSRYPDPPNVGDQVLLFVPGDPHWTAQQAEPYLDFLDDSGIVTIHADSTVSVPKKFGAVSTPKSMGSTQAADLLVRVRNAAKQGER